MTKKKRSRPQTARVQISKNCEVKGNTHELDMHDVAALIGNLSLHQCHNVKFTFSFSAFRLICLNWTIYM